ncbi:MAG: DUF4070 domain-containing protein [Deltaproteobacteria bacterium]|nr:DUF4070 domain-containing protein [Deltaproteobacteria bacterium]
MLRRRIKTARRGKAATVKRVCLVAPRHPESFWSLQGTVELLNAKTLVPNSALATLIALTPDDVGVEYVLLDENVSRLDPSIDCDLVAITGATLHSRRIVELCRIFRERGVPVALGGTYATLQPDRCEGLADHLFIGEAEHTWPEFLREWAAGNAAPVYRQEGFIDLADSPAPDWSLLEPKDYLSISVQTSRGCPNRCDFCDVIQYVGRKYRTKSVDQVLEEVRRAHGLGAHSVFFSDDNFLGNVQFTRELLPRLIEWNRAQDRPLAFSTQITVKVADDEELLKLFADALFSVLFLGVETPRREALEEVGKAQNLSRPLDERLTAISRFGIVPFLGLIVGFDADDAGVFDEMYGFVDETASPIVGVSLLNAPRHTPLFERLEQAGRLVGDDFSGEWQLETNIVPKQLTREELVRGYWELFVRIYEPEAFDRRLQEWLKKVEYFAEQGYEKKKTNLWELLNMLRVTGKFLFRSEKQVRRLFLRNMKRARYLDSGTRIRMFTLLAQYRHFRDFVTKPRQLPAA